MLEDCGSLSDCENQLKPLIQQISIIGQIPLTEEDIDKLCNLIKEKTETNIEEGTWELEKLFPTCFACFLVWKGHDEYRGGDFWSSVRESLNLPKDARWQREWGEAFIEFLKRSKLPFFYIEDAHRYVTPIVFHSGIPTYCLNDFFQNLLVPIVSGQLGDDITNIDEIINEWRDSSLFDRTDKPVRRFFQYGQEVAKNFIDRCIEMVQRAYKAYEEDDEIPSYDELELPENVVRHFQEWWDKYRVEKPPPEKVASRFRSPIIALNVGLGEIQVKIPPQSVDKSEPKEASIEILIENNEPSLNRLKVYKRNKLLETSEIQIPLDKSAEDYEIRLLWDNERIRTWKFKGSNQEKPWLAFLSDSNKLIQDGTLSTSQVWLVIPKDYSFEPDIPIIEECSQLYGDWRNHSCFLVDLSSANNLHLVSSRQSERILIPISTEKTSEPKLVGGIILNLINSEDKPVYVERPPNIQIPIANSLNPELEIQRWRLSIIPQGETSIGNRLKNMNLADLVEVPKGQTYFQISLSDERLLGESPIGSFLVRLRGRLGKDRQLRFCLIPLLDINFDKKIYLPDKEGNITDAEVTISTLSDAEVRVEGPGQVISNDLLGEFVIKVPAIETSLNCVWNYSLPSGEIRIPLTIQVPRVRWLLRGLTGHTQNEWLMVPHEITLSDWEDSPELELLVQAPLPDGCEVTLGLKESDKIETKQLRKGGARFNLKSFSDELRNLEQPISEFYLKIEGIDLEQIEAPTLYVKTEWFVEELLEIIQEVKNDQRTIYLEWKEEGRIRNRAICIWNLYQPWLEPIQESIIHSKSDLTIKRPLSGLPPGNYRLEFFQEDLWVAQSTQKLFIPEASAPNIFDREIGSKDELLDRYKHLGNSFREQLEKLAILKLLKDDVKLIEQINQMKIESLSTENLGELAILMISWLPDEDTIQKLWSKLIALGNLENQFEDILKYRRESVDEVNKKRVIHLAVVLNLTPPDSPFRKGEIVVYKERGWIGYIKGFSPTSKREYGKWLLEICYKHGSKNLVTSENFEKLFSIVVEKDLPKGRRKRK